MLRFEGRDLKPYPEHLKPNKFEQDHVYFDVTFADEQLLYPTLRPWVFVGRDFEAGDSGLLYFQDLDSYSAGVRYSSTDPGEEGEFLALDEKEMSGISHYEHALDELLRCSLRRKETSGLR